MPIYSLAPNLPPAMPRMFPAYSPLTGSSNANDNLRPNWTDELLIDPALAAFEMNIPISTDADHIADHSLGISGLEALYMPRLNPHLLRTEPKRDSSYGSALFGGSLWAEDVPSDIATASVESQSSRDLLVSDAPLVIQSLTQLEVHACAWRGCLSRFSKLAGLRLHARSHTKGAQRCLWDGCRRHPESVSSLNKHLDSHIKPHGCPEANCGHRAATRRDIDRHVVSHGISVGTKVFFCPAIGCQYSEGRTPFWRADNGKRHIRQVHPDLHMDLVTRTYNE